jgi:multidrug resistance efflux pump
VDIPVQRSRSRLGRYRRWLVTAAVVTTILAGATVALGRLRSEPPAVARASVWMGRVERGEMLREVQGNGKLVPEHIQWVTAVSAARVERIFVRPGTAVEKDTILLELGNPDLELLALEAERQVAAARAELASMRAELRGGRLAQKAAVATLRIDQSTAKRRADANVALGDHGYVSNDDAHTTRAALEALELRVGVEAERLTVMGQGMHERLSAQATQIERLETIVEFRRNQLDALRVRAGVDGMLQELPLEAGQWVTPGALLAKVARPDELKARLAIPETLAKDVAIGQPAHIDTRNGMVDGTVSRVDPAASGGTVTVDVALTGPLPKGARPDLSVVGTVELERLPDVLHVRRPAFVQPGTTVGVFRIDPDGQYATRVHVQVGRASVTTVELLAGLADGDQIIVSDMSMWDSRDRLKLE